MVDIKVSIILILSLIVVVMLASIGRIELKNTLANLNHTAYNDGLTTGYDMATQDITIGLMNNAVGCKVTTIAVGNVTANLIPTECLQQQ